VKQQLKLLIASLVLAFILCGAVSAADSSSDDSEVEAQMMNVSVPFVENQGQIDSEVSYYANTFYGTSYVTQDGITHQIIGEDNKTLVVKEQFLDKQGNPITFQAQGEEPSATVVSYFTGNNPDNWQTNLPTYNFINLGELYPGITVKLRATGSNIEKLFFVNPGANPNDIQIRILGADGLTIDEEGNLVINSDGFPDVSMSQPIAFQENNNIEVQYQVKENTYGFTIGNYDHNKQLTIDPTLQYSTYLGGYNTDNGNDIAVDGDGNAYITGSTNSLDFPTTPGAYQTSHAGSYYNDAFVTKLNPAGTGLVYSTYLGGSMGYDGNDYGLSIAVDSNGNAYITGQTYSTDFPTTPGAYQTSLASYYDGFVTKLNPTGTGLVYSTYLGGTGNDYGYSIAVDGSGNAYITGSTNSVNFPTTSGAYQTSRSGYNNDAFVSKLNPTGTGLVYSTYLGGTNYDYGYGVAVDGAGNAYIAGYTYSTDFPTTTGAYQTSHAGSCDVFVSKLNPTGNALIYSTYLGGYYWDYGYGVVVDGDGNAYITGSTCSMDFPTTLGAYQTSLAGNTDVFVSKLNPTGNALVYSTYLGGYNYDEGRAIVVDGDGNAYITGFTGATDFPTTLGAYQTSRAGDYDAFVTKLNPTGNALAYSTYLGGASDDYGRGIAVDGDDNAYITGFTYSTDFPTTTGAYQTNNEGNYDAFVAKLSTVNPMANVTVTKTGNGPLNVGDTGTFTVSLHNNGPDAAHNVAVTDINVPDGWTVTPSVGSWDSNTNTWNVGTLNNGDGATLTISGTVTTAMAGTTITNTVIETQDEFTQETQSATASITVNPMANVTVTKTGNGPLNVGDTGTFTVSLHNNGPDAAHNVAVTDINVPDGWTVTPSVGSWDSNTNTWNVGTLNNGDGATLTISGTVTTAMAGTTITNTVIETQDEFTQETQSATASITVNPETEQADLYINSWSSKSNPTVGEIYTITFKLGNRGPDTAENVVFTLPLPDGVEFVDVNVDQGTTSYDPATRTITWTLGDVVVGDPYAWVRVRSLNVGSFIFRPTLTTDTDDPNIESNIQTVTVNVQAAGEPSETVHAQTVGMQETGAPIVPLALAILSILGGIVSSRKNK